MLPPDTDDPDELVPYINRPAYETEFDAILSSGVKLIGIEGEPGNGKTRLARELVTRRMQVTDAKIELEASNITKLMTDIAGLLQRFAGNWSEAHLATDEALNRAFAQFLCSPQAPTYVVLDGVEDPELLDQLISKYARSTVIVTSRENVLPQGRGKSMIITEMEYSEACQLAEIVLPAEDREDVKRLVMTLGNRPLAIDHACNGLLVDGYMSISDFLSTFNDHAATIMRHAKSRVEDSLPFIYEQILIRLRGRDERGGTKAAALLELIAFMAPDFIPADILSDVLAVTSPPEEPGLAPLQFQSAQRELRRLNLIRRQAGGFSIHQFTQAILRDALRDVAMEKCLALHGRLVAEFDQARQEEYQEERTLRLLPHILDLVTTLNGVAPASVKRGVDRTLEVLLARLRRFSDASLAARVILRI